MKAKTTQEITESMRGWTPKQMAEVKFAKLIGPGNVVAVRYRKGAIVYGDVASELIAAGKAVEIIDKMPQDQQQ